MEGIPSLTQESTSVLSTPALSKDIVPSDIEFSHRGETYDPIRNKRNQVVYAALIPDEVCYITHSYLHSRIW